MLPPNDPVYFEDEAPIPGGAQRSYEREEVEKYVLGRTQRGLPIESPLTRKVLERHALLPNVGLRERVLATQHKRAFNVDGNESILLLHEVFDKLDGLRSVLDATIDGWKPPLLVVLGAESMGKSTLLERLTMMNLFPRHRKI